MALRKWDIAEIPLALISHSSLETESHDMSNSDEALDNVLLLVQQTSREAKNNIKQHQCFPVLREATPGCWPVSCCWVSGSYNDNYEEFIFWDVTVYSRLRANCRSGEHFVSILRAENEGDILLRKLC